MKQRFDFPSLARYFAIGGFLFLALRLTPVVAQNIPPPDSTGLPDELVLPDTSGIETITTKSMLIPRRAALMAAAFPGLGQVYNRKYWKVPLVYIGAGIFGYLITDFNQKYQTFREANILRRDGNPNTIDRFVNQYSDDQINRAAEGYRRYRDLNIILATGFYFLQIVDAYVDAQLSEFNVNDDLSGVFRPSLEPVGFSATPAAGLSLVLVIK
ncbi:hypothetical protein SAMN05421823_101482 [Catalinimonas alkaloidigena]|uniref:DUF5683 domain-containing protein n=1 Tax=Catalinimonas alkaloidigena TaxID=1075417 RepID=A0A1G8XUI2_9BACT|nr:DUF5683 domain-containing protein [Catalinimonas alkaloidigena]SDJ94292.1 hypothetical protein SAMN05421823_101482 [Catalinimonas alkaloidigena]